MKEKKKSYITDFKGATLLFRKRQHANKKKYTKMSRFNIYQQLHAIVDSFSFDVFPQFRFPTKQ
jgi:hypothetical protein